ncbi:MAG: sulfatase [Puniceicoccaceae bacterium 5H]|nr:MAG: sulfatase [Puniceicoccaceae bacterium 5H]
MFRHPLKLTLLVLCAALVASAFGQPKRPNVIFIMSDDHAVNAISAYGSDLVETPQIDRLASQGMRFTNAFCTNSICGPARAVILTGKYSHLNGYMVNETTRFDGSQTTFPQLFQQAGYETAIIGKWHLGSEPTGFDHWDILDGQGQYFNPPFITDGQMHVEKGYVTDIIADKTVDWLRHHDPDQPFMLISQHKAPHSNFQPPPRYAHAFDDVTFAEPDNLFDDYSDRSEAARDNNMRIDPHLTLQYMSDDPLMKVPEDLTGQDRTRWMYQYYLRHYLGCVLAVDDAVGRIMDTLDELGLADNTIVVYTSDQGFFLGEHGWYDKRFMYEESLQIPLIFRYPEGIQSGQVEDRFALNLDFAQTLLDFAGIPAPDDMQGRSLKPILEGDPIALWRRSMYYHYYEYPGWHFVKRHYGVRSERFKLIHYYHDIDAWELYDLQEDPHEMHNVYDDPAYAGVRETMHQELTRLQQQYGDSPELAEEMLRRYPHGSMPAWGRYEDLPREKRLPTPKEQAAEHTGH